MALIAFTLLVAGCPDPTPRPAGFSAFTRIHLLPDGRILGIGTGGDSASFSGLHHHVNVLLLDPDGALIDQSVHSFGIGSRTDALVRAGDDEFIACGWYALSHTRNAGLVMKIDSAGSLTWSDVDDDLFQRDVVAARQLDQGRVQVAGVDSAGTRIVEFGNDGTVLSNRLVKGPRTYAALFLNDGSLLTTGVGVNAAITEYDEGDVMAWQSLLLPEVDVGSFPNEVLEASNGDILVAGTYSFPETIFLVRFQRDGSMAWMREIAVESGVEATALREDSNGSLYAGGAGILLKFDADGDELWRVSIDGALDDVQISNDGTVMAVGFRRLEVSDRDVRRMLMMRFDKDGNFVSDDLFEGLSR